MANTFLLPLELFGRSDAKSIVGSKPCVHVDGARTGSLPNASSKASHCLAGHCCGVRVYRFSCEAPGTKNIFKYTSQFIYFYNLSKKHVFRHLVASQLTLSSEYATLFLNLPEVNMHTSTC